MFNINRLQKAFRKKEIKRDAEQSALAPDQSLDSRLSYNSEEGESEKWTFENNRILVDDEDVGDIVNRHAHDIGVLSSVSYGLEKYRQFVWAINKGNDQFNGAVQGLQEKVLGRMGNIYDDITGGVRFELNRDRLWINNVDVRSVINLYRLRPTHKARAYLKGLRDKLGLVLSRQKSSNRIDGVHSKASQVMAEISAALLQQPADEPPRQLTAGRSA